MQKEISDASAHQLWQTNNHPIEVYTPKVIQQKLDYIHFNPVRAGFVSEPAHYIYNSAGNYLQNKAGPLEVEILEAFYSRIF